VLLNDPIFYFAGKTVLITGAATGFGEMLAKELGVRAAQLVLGEVNMECVASEIESHAIAMNRLIGTYQRD